MDIHTQSGDRVIFSAVGGYEIQKQSALQVGLTVGAVYEVLRVEVGGFSSDVVLKEFPEHKFNTCMFENSTYSREFWVNSGL